MICQFDLTELEFRLIRDFIHDRYGIYFKDDKISFVRMKLYSRLESLGLNSFMEYFNYIKFNTDSGRELSKMLALLTNNETYFFRELPQLKVLQEALLKQLHEKKTAGNERVLKILSAGCSTGEEVYTLAMLMFETGCFFWGWDVQIIGMDISETALETAKRGIYYWRSLRMSEPEWIRKFFSINSGDYIVKENIKRMATFFPGNILDPQIWQKLNGIDIILCRNVLIYFSDEKVKETINHFYNALRKGGYLLLGHSETLTEMPTDFESVRFPETIVYRKRE